MQREREFCRVQRAFEVEAEASPLRSAESTRPGSAEEGLDAGADGGADARAKAKEIGEAGS